MTTVPNGGHWLLTRGAEDGKEAERPLDGRVDGKTGTKKKKSKGADLEKKPTPGMWSFSSLKSFAAPIGQVLTLALKVKSAVAVAAADFITAGWHELHAWGLFYPPTFTPTPTPGVELCGGQCGRGHPTAGGDHLTKGLFHFHTTASQVICLLIDVRYLFLKYVLISVCI